MIANWMIGCGLIALIVGAIVYGFNSGGYVDSAGAAYFGLALGATGGQVAVLGLHALAVRQAA